MKALTKIFSTGIFLAAGGSVLWYALTASSGPCTLLSEEAYGTRVPSRAEQWASLSSGQPFDVLVVGGGSAGGGCCLDSATRSTRSPSRGY